MEGSGGCCVTSHRDPGQGALSALGHGGVGEPLCHVLHRHQGGGTDVAVSMWDPIKRISVEPWGEAEVLELRHEWTVETHRR